MAQSAGIGGLDPSIAKDPIDSEDPQHTQNRLAIDRIDCLSIEQIGY